jgi:hypothetical protein
MAEDKKPRGGKKRKGSAGQVVGKPKTTITPVKVGGKEGLSKKATVANVSGFAKTANAFQSGGSFADINFVSPDYYHPELQPDQLLLPKSRREKNLWARHFYENDPIVSAGVDFHSEAPLSNIRLQLPESKDHGKAQEILAFYEEMVERIELFSTLLQISHEFWLFGNCFPFAEWDDELKSWASVIVLDPNDVIVRKYPFSNNVDIELQVPPDITNIISNPDPRYAEILSDIPKEILEFVRHGRHLPLDTDPYSGSHISHIARKKSAYRNLGTSIIERVFKDLVYKDRLQNAQQAIADRNMSPKHLISAEDVGEESLEDLREQVEVALSDPDSAIVTNYAVNWQLIGANERLLQIQSDLEFINSEILSGIGLTPSLITGEGTYGGDYVALEVINQRYLLYREVLVNWVENNLFKPVAFHNGFYEKNSIGQRKLLYPKMRFNRLNLRDNTEAFSNLFNLYSKGSLDVSTILEFFHIDPIEVKKRLESDMFTVNDATFNDLMRSVYGELGREVVGRSDLLEKVLLYLNLQESITPEEGGEEDVF